MSNERSLSVVEIWRLALVDPTVIEVIDHGEGIGEEVKERLQLGFAQRSETGDQHTQGTGLWLARALVKAYGGSLHHQNVLGGGTRFVCAFPSRAVGLDA